MFQILEIIDKAVELQANCTLTDKMGGCFHGRVSDSWIRVSGGKLRGKLAFVSEEKGEFQIDGNDILDLRLHDSAK